MNIVKYKSLSKEDLSKENLSKENEILFEKQKTIGSIESRFKSILISNLIISLIVSFCITCFLITNKWKKSKPEYFNLINTIIGKKIIKSDSIPSLLLLCFSNFFIISFLLFISSLFIILIIVFLERFPKFQPIAYIIFFILFCWLGGEIESRKRKAQINP